MGRYEKEDGSIKKLQKKLKELSKKVQNIEKEIRLLATSSISEGEVGGIRVEGSFMDLIDVLGSLEEKNTKNDWIKGDNKIFFDLLTRFLFRQEAQNTQIKLLLLSERYSFRGEIFDEINYFLRDVEDERFQIEQLKFRWREIERMVRQDILKFNKAGSNDNSI